MRFIYFASLIIALCSCATPQSRSELIVENQVVNVDSANITVDLQYPVFVAGKSESFKKAFNARVQQIIENLTPRPQGRSQREPELDNMIYDPAMNDPVSSLLRWNMLAGEKIVTLELGGYTQKNANQPTDFRYMEFFDAQSGETLELKDFITDSILILKLVHEELTAQQVDLPPEYSLPLARCLLLDSANLTALYRAGEIGSLFQTPIEIPIYLEDLSGALKLQELDPWSLVQIKPSK